MLVTLSSWASALRFWLNARQLHLGNPTAFALTTPRGKLVTVL